MFTNNTGTILLSLSSSPNLNMKCTDLFVGLLVRECISGQMALYFYVKE